MVKKSILTIALLSSMTLQAEDIKVGESTNNGLLGNNFVMAYIGTNKYGDEDTADLYDSNTQFNISGSFKANDNVALLLSVQTISVDIDHNGATGDFSGTALSIGALYHFLPTETIDPYIEVSFASISSDMDMQYQGNTYSDSYSNNGYLISAGAEFDLSDTVFLTPSVSYYKVGDEDAGKDITLEINAEVAYNVFVGGGIDMELGETDTTYYVGLGYKF